MRQFGHNRNTKLRIGPNSYGSSSRISLERDPALAARFAFTVLLSFLLSFAVPVAAFADYVNLSVTGTAQVNTDASMKVVERRSFDFTEHYSALVWSIPGHDDGREINVSSMRVLQTNNEGKSTGHWETFKEVPFSESWRELVGNTGGKTDQMNAILDGASDNETDDFVTRPQPNTYSFDSVRDQIYIFPDSIIGNVGYECTYTIKGAINVYDDVAELYWTYSCPVDDKSAKDIHMRIKLPVPKGAEVKPNENVYAWGHGPEGTIAIRTDGVIDVYVPEVKARQYSLVHIVFPRSWVPNVDTQSEIYRGGTRLGYALWSEENWTDAGAAHTINSYAIGISLCVVCAIALLLTFILYLLFGRESAPTIFLEEDASKPRSVDAGVPVDGGSDAKVPVEGDGANVADGTDGADVANSAEGEPDSAKTSDSLKQAEYLLANKPAVCGRLIRWDHHSTSDLSSVLEKLIDMHVVQVTVDEEDPSKTRFRLTPTSKMSELDDVEKGALHLLFDQIDDGYQSISIGDIKQYCEKNPRKAIDEVAEWQNIVTRQLNESNVFDKKSIYASYAVYAAAGILAIVALAVLIFCSLIGEGLMVFAVALICVVMAYKMPRRTQVGVDLAQMLDDQEREAEEELEDVGADSLEEASNGPSKDAEGNTGQDIDSTADAKGVESESGFWGKDLADAFGDASNA